MQAKPQKERSKNYEKKLAVKATFDEIIGLALGKPIKKQKSVKRSNKK